MKKVLICFLALTAAIGVTAQKAAVKVPATKVTTKTTAVSTVQMKNLSDSFSYAAGFNIASNMKQQGITTLNTTLLKRAIDDVLGGKPCSVNEQQSVGILSRQMQIFSAAKQKEDKAAGIAFLANNGKRKGVVTLPDGLQYEIVTIGNIASNKARAEDTAVVNYAGTLIDGTEFDNSYKRGEAAVFPLNRVIKGWSEIIQLMPVGAKWKVWVPTELAYDMNPPSAQIPVGAALVFEISLEGIKPATAQKQP